MKKFAIGILAVLAIILAGCVPVASLETAAPANGSQFAVGATSVIIVDPDNTAAGAMPYLSYSWGNGTTEFSISSQMGLRGAVKQLVAENTSLEGGVTLMWTIFAGDIGSDIPVTADLGILYDINKNLTLNLRGMYIYATQELGSAWAAEANLTYFYDHFAFEGGLLFPMTADLPALSLSGAYRF